MKYDYRAKGGADFTAGAKDPRLFHNTEDHGRLYREGWHAARRAKEMGPMMTGGEGFEHAGVNVPTPAPPVPAQTPAAVVVPPVVTPPAPSNPAGWQGIKAGTWHFFEQGKKKSVCGRTVRTSGPAGEPDGLLCSLCEKQLPPVEQLALF